MQQICLHILFGFSWLIERRMQHFSNQITKIKSGNPVQSQSSVQRDDFWFCWTVRNWSLFLTHRADWDKCVTSENTQCSLWSRFSDKISVKVRVLKQCQSALLRCIIHWQYYQWDGCKKCVCHKHRSTWWLLVQVWSLIKNVWFYNACQIHVFQDKLNAYFWRFTNGSQFLLL